MASTVIVATTIGITIGGRSGVAGIPIWSASRVQPQRPATMPAGMPMAMPAAARQTACQPTVARFWYGVKPERPEHAQLAAVGADRHDEGVCQRPGRQGGDDHRQQPGQRPDPAKVAHRRRRCRREPARPDLVERRQRLVGIRCPGGGGPATTTARSSCSGRGRSRRSRVRRRPASRSWLLLNTAWPTTVRRCGLASALTCTVTSLPVETCSSRIAVRAERDLTIALRRATGDDRAPRRRARPVEALHGHDRVRLAVDQAVVLVHAGRFGHAVGLGEQGGEVARARVRRDERVPPRAVAGRVVEHRVEARRRPTRRRR